MSFTELQTGKVKVLGQMTQEDVDNYCKEIVEKNFPNKYEHVLKDGFPCWSNGWIEVLNDELTNDEMYRHINGILYHIFDVKNHEDEGYFYIMDKTGEDEYSFITKYHNGGTCLYEVIEHGLNNL